MDLASLRFFRAVAEHGNVTQAAHSLNTVQSNVTTRLRQLEEELGTPLFDRINRRLVITQAGRLLNGYAERLLALAEEASAAVRASDRPHGLLRLGSMETTAAARLPVLLAMLRQRFPDIELRLSTGPTAQLVQDVLTHQLDAALVAAPVLHPQLAMENVMMEQPTLISAVDWPTLDNPETLAGQGPIAIFTFREGCSYRQRLLNWLHQNGLQVAQVNEFGTFEAIIACVAAGMGVSLLPRSVLQAHLAAGTIREQPTPVDMATSQTLLIWHAERSHHPARAAFADLLQDYSASIA
ncbi:MAG: LysR family transcriptional regulator [Burkholderiales bacterium]|nr:LysR family transcriptional regulator [Burkholderiales bacterium]